MLEVVNTTRFGFLSLPALDKQGEELLVVCVAATYSLPPAGRQHAEPPPLAQEQPPPPVEDAHVGKPGLSSLRREGQSAYARPEADVYVNGTAWTPGARPALAVEVSVQVGTCKKSIAVVGPRYWRSVLGSLQQSKPEPFVSMPLCYEQSFGGPSAGDGATATTKPHPANPVGCGNYANAREAADKPLPRIEDRKTLIIRCSDRPAPAGLGPIARHWEPRCRFAGTYDERWRRERAPWWPSDFNERFFQAAAPGLRIPYPQGGEPVVLTGLSPDGTVGCCLPANRFELVGTPLCAPLVLDAIDIDGDAATLTLVYRTAVRLTTSSPAAWGQLRLRQVRP